MAEASKIYSREEIDNLRQRLSAYREEATPRRTWPALAAATGVNEKTLAAWTPGTYDNGEYWKNQDIPAKVERFLHSLQERAALATRMPRRLEFQETPSAKRMMTALALAQLGDMALIATDPGCGKTVATRRFKATRANVFMATVARGSGGPADILGGILADMGEPGAKGSIASLTRRIVERLHGADALLIVDEAQYATAASLDQLRAIHDITECGLALVGDDKLPGLLRGHAQLHSRIGVSHIQRVPEQGDIDALAAAWGVEGGELLAYLRQIGSVAKVGGLRRVDKVIRLALMSTGGGLTLQDLKDAYVQRYREAA